MELQNGRVGILRDIEKTGDLGMNAHTKNLPSPIKRRTTTRITSFIHKSNPLYHTQKIRSMTTTTANTTTLPISAPTIDAGIALHSPSTELMQLVNIHSNNNNTTTDFTTITTYIEKHLYDIIHEIHHTYDKLLIDNGQVQINCPPHHPEVDHSDTHHPIHTSSTLILRTLSEKEMANHSGIVAKREIKVYDCGPDPTEPNKFRTILIREDIIEASHNLEDTHPSLKEQSVTLRIPLKTLD